MLPSVLVARLSASFSFQALFPLVFATPFTPEPPEILGEGLFATLWLVCGLSPLFRTLAVAKTMVWAARSHLLFSTANLNSLISLSFT